MKKLFIFMFIFVSIIYAENIFKLNKIEDISNGYKLNFFNIKNNGIPIVSIDFNNTNQKLIATAEKNTIVYILIDSSIPLKKAYNKGIKPFLKNNFIPFLKNKKIRIIVSHFNSNLIQICDSKKNKCNMDNIKITGKTTELWRNTLDALKRLSAMPEKRKILVLLSDGDAEDTPAYSIKDVISFAKKHYTRIISISYLNKITTQNMRKISEETYGKVFIANKKYQISTDTFKKSFNDILKSDFNVIIPQSYLKPNVNGIQTIHLSFNIGNISESQDIDLIVNKTVNEKTNFIEKYKYYFIGLLIFITILILYFLLKKPKEELNDEEIDSNTIIIQEPEKPIAILESMGGTIHNIYKFPSTIGKKKENDLVIEGDYISRNHAVIDFKDGFYYILDRGSANGTKINGKDIRNRGSFKIKPNDIIEFGPYKTIFKLK